MSRAAASAGAVLVVGALAVVGACPPTVTTRCTLDTQCQTATDAYHRCDVASGRCLCTDNRGCGVNETCNAIGRCQVVAGCHDNDDCGEGLFCRSGNCDARAGCGAERCCSTDAACPYKQICDVLTWSCVPGCRDEADCLIGQGCIGAGGGRLGSCDAACTSDALCRPGELCNLSLGICERDTRGPYCRGCSGGVQSDDCGADGNYCLLDTVNGGAYCGVDCSRGQACPNGYECKDVIILPASTLPVCALPEACVEGSCGRTGGSCLVDEDCPEGPPGSTCPRADVGNCELDTNVPCSVEAECSGIGACLKQQCRTREGAGFGVCSCTKDTDCPRDRCVGADTSDPANPIYGACELSGHPCTLDFECDVITCVQGGCLLGKNCKPADDRTCVDTLQ
ncbi:MAG: hypothetical protein HYS27_16845 [Deltaproteobacteria bacterium]|nr:hypothetical protein [Deltaproteobacteria bacterium]